MKTWLAALLASTAILLLPTAHAIPQVGDVPPSYLGKDQKGKKVELEDLRGKVVIVTFWATWCVPCRKELSVLETIQQHAGRDRVHVVAVNIEKARVYRPMKRRLKDYKMTLTNDHYGRIKKSYGVNGIPHLVMIKKDGTIAAIKRGYSEAMVPAVIDEVNALMRAEYATATERQ
ncbi:MAG: TlpA disulfide reductase family protein [Gammaproteobacteria bacterium]|nr:TlpA disulfide reductase family protein [Gammaproteobacteria bacterium]